MSLNMQLTQHMKERARKRGHRELTTRRITYDIPNAIKLSRKMLVFQVFA